MVKDLYQADGDRAQIQILNETIDKKDSYIAKQDSISSLLKSRLASCNATMDEYAKIDDMNQKTINSLKKAVSKYKRNSTWFKVLLGVSLVGLAIK